MWILLVGLGMAPEPEITLLTDAKQHLVAVAVKDMQSRLWYGDAQSLAAVPVDAADNTGPMPDGSWKRKFIDPRYKRPIESYKDIQKTLTRVSFDGKAYTLQCGERSVPLTLVPNDKAKGLLASAKRETPEPVKPYALARDDRGTYYYVDRAGEKRFRVYAGPKGSLKRLKMKNVVSDSEGDLFATTTGDLRLLVDKKEVTWIEPAGRRKLTLVPTAENLPMIYSELGVYAGDKLGTPCDDL
jgi:hypothetical protein